MLCVIIRVKERQMTKMIIRTYNELKNLQTFEERFNYLKLGGIVGDSTFGFDRYLGQDFYKSREWRLLRDYIIVRDDGCDLGIPERPIFDQIYIHHMNPIGKEDILNQTEFLLNPKFLICTSLNTHNAIHYGDASLLPVPYTERYRNDTIPWKL